MTTSRNLERAHGLYLDRAWSDAYSALLAADEESRLAPADIQRLAVAATLTGNADESVTAWERAYRELLDAGEVPGAVRCAFWLVMELVQQGEAARGSGWLARAERLLAEGRHDCAEQGYLLLPGALRGLAAGDVPGALACFTRAAALAEHSGDTDLVALTCLGRGQCLIRLGEVGEGMALLDEAMVGVTAGEVSPVASGLVYCAVILACQDAFDLHRAQEWTTALDHWCAAQQGLVLFRGQCLVHRSQIMLLRGDWSHATHEARLARDRLSSPRAHPALGMALYQQAELHRLRGEFDEAEETYRAASRATRDPQPGLALLRLARGDVEAARRAIRRVLEEVRDRAGRAQMLPACVEIMLAAADVPAARLAADELSELAAELDAPLLHALSTRATGAVLLAEGDAGAACDVLRRSWRLWHELDAPYEVARVRVLIARACRELGDPGTADMELDAARGIFRQLGAAPDLDRLEEIAPVAVPPAAGGLTGRELQVLALAATGRTNREIAAELVISEHTVRRHLQNVFTKIDVRSRAAAATYAFRRGLL